MEGLKEENKLEILGNLLECWAYGGDGDELGDVEKDGENNHRKNMKEDDQIVAARSHSLLINLLVRKQVCFVTNFTW